MSKLKNRGMGTLYIILVASVAIAFSVTPLSNLIPSIDLQESIGNFFSFELAPNQFADCTVRQFLFYIDSAGNRRQGDFDFDIAGLYTQFDLVSRATGITIEKFEVDTYLKCSSDLAVANFDLVPTSSIIYSVRIDDKDGKTLLVREAFVDPTIPPVGTRFASANRMIDVLNKEVKIATFSINAEEVEEKIDPNKCGLFGCATGSTPTQTFNSHFQIVTDYAFDFDILNVKWEAFGKLFSGYQVRFEDTDFTGTISEPKSTDIKVFVVRPYGAVFSEGITRILQVEATLPEWQTAEGNPTMNVKSEQTQGTISNTVMDIGRQISGATVFTKQIVFPSTEDGTFKISVSLPKRVTGTAYVATFETSEEPPPPMGGTTCNIPAGITEGCPTNTCEDNGQITSTFFGVGRFCVPLELAFLFQGYNLIWLIVGIIFLLIIIKAIVYIAQSGNKEPPHTAFYPTGY